MNKNKEKCVILFVKHPTMGMVKTRLGEQIGQDEAANLYRNFVIDILATLENIDAHVNICFTPASAKDKFVSWLGNGYSYTAQDGSDLGERMSNAFVRIFDQGFSTALLIGSDIPDLPEEFLRTAFEALPSNDAVIGPAGDGGYYLLGFSKETFEPQVFQDINWSTNKVFEQTMKILNQSRKKVHILEKWYDVDTPADLESLISRNKNTAFSTSNTITYLNTIRDLPQSNFFVKLLGTITGKKNRMRMILLLVVIALIFGLRLTGIADKLTLSDLQANAERLKDFSYENYLRSVLTYIGVYIIVTSFSLPGATVLTLAGGFLYNFFLGAIYVNIAATTGATLAFLFARYIAGQSLQKKYAGKLTKFNEELDRNGASYLLTLRFIPLFPFFMINLIAGLTNISLWTYVWTTSLGILPGSLIYAYAGQQLGHIRSVRDIFTPTVLVAFILLAAFALIPVIYKKIKRKND